MIQYLENGKKYNIKELSQKLEVSERMIRVYKEDLEKTGIFIDSVMWPYGGYVLNKSIRIPTRKFSKDDYLFLKDSAIINNDDKEKVAILADKIHGVYFDYINENIELKDRYNILTRAIKKRKVKINYYSFTHGNQDRIYKTIWYVFI